MPERRDAESQERNGRQSPLHPPDMSGERKRPARKAEEPVEPSLRLPASERLSRLLDAARGRRHGLILTHDNPDPDSLAAAVGLARLLEARLGITSRVAYGGIIGRAENKAMVKVLHLPVVPISRVIFAEHDLLALVDTQPSVGNHSLPPRYRPDLVIDHHPPREASRHVPFADVGRDYGATCTIVLEYLREAKINLSPQIATALFYGIKADTRDLGRQTYPIDIDSYLFLFPMVDKVALSHIEHPALPARYFRLYNLAIERARVHDTAVVSDLGEVYSPDMVAEVAERLLPLEGMKWSLALGSYQNQLYLSLRTNDRRMNAGRLTRDICVDLGGSAGGHGTMAGARIPLTGTRTTRERLKRRLIHRFLEEVGVHDPRGRPLLTIDRT